MWVMISVRLPILRIFLLGMLFFWASYSAAGLAGAEASSLQLEPDTQSIVVPKQRLSYFEDPDDVIGFEQVKKDFQLLFAPITGESISIGNTDSSIWAHFSVVDRSGTGLNSTWLLDIDFSMLKRLDIYVVQDGNLLNHFSIGYENPMSIRALPYRFFAQPLLLEENVKYDIFLNAKREHGAIKVPLRLTRPLPFIASEVTNNYVFGILFGVMLAMMIYNFFIFISVGERIYLYYILYIGFSCVTLLALSGYGFFLLWPGYPAVNDYVISLSALSACISALLFTRHFIREEYLSKPMDRTIDMLVAIGAALIVIKLITGRYLGIELSIYIGLLSVVAPIFTGFCWYKGSRSAGFFFLSWSVLMVGNVIYTLMMANFLAQNIFTENAVLIGSAGEMLLLSWGLAERINRAKRSELIALQERHEAALKLKEAEERLMHRALHSGSTGLPNRAFFKSTIDEILETESELKFAVLLVTINNFHEFNKTFGHSNSSAILSAFIDRLKPICSQLPGILVIEKNPVDPVAVATVEGVTFGMLIAENNPEKLFRIGLSLLAKLEEPLDYQGLNLTLEATGGYALFPTHGNSGDELIRNAHIALDAGTRTSEKLAIYSQKIDPYNERRISLVGALRSAMENDELELHYQPQIRLATSRVSGVEVLIRWNHPEFGFIPPDEFIPLAERTGTIQPLTLWVAEKAFAFKRKLDDSGVKINFSINISARNLQDSKFKNRICEIAERHGVRLDEVVMELTETAIMNDPEAARAVMAELSAEGVKLSIDDFGTGHASLSYIRKLPVNEIKIDRSFVMEMISNHDDQVIVNTTLLMGHNLNLQVVAEGIEDYSTLMKLKEMGCDLAQGYHIARPMSGNRLFDWLADYRGKVEHLKVVNNEKL